MVLGPKGLWEIITVHLSIQGTRLTVVDRVFCTQGSKRGSMQIQEIELSELKPYEKNAKKHPPEQVEHIANSLREFGWKQPIVIDTDNVIIAGHGRVLAAKKLGWETAPCIYADDLTEDQIKAFRLADNKTAESDWDFALLSDELDDIALDMSQFGFADMFNEPEDEDADVIEDEIPNPPAEPKAKPGDIYELGGGTGSYVEIAQTPTL